jgi:hypothetical protein
MIAQRRVAPSVPVPATPTPQDDDIVTGTISLRFGTQVLSRVDDSAKRLGLAAQRGCSSRPESCWETVDNLSGARECEAELAQVHWR